MKHTKRSKRHVDPALVRSTSHQNVSAYLQDNSVTCKPYSMVRTGGPTDTIAPCAKNITSAFLSVPDRPYVSGIAQEVSHLPKLYEKVTEFVDVNVERTTTDYAQRGDVPTTLLSPVKETTVDLSQPIRTLHHLESLAGQALVGKDNETVLDVSVRDCLSIDNEFIHVGWEDGLQQALVTVSSVLCEPTDLTAELHDVLLYKPGSFFKEHKDSKKHPQHKMTLVVDCGRFTAHFDDANEEERHDVKKNVSQQQPAIGGGSVVFLSDVPTRLNYKGDAESDDDYGDYYGRYHYRGTPTELSLTDSDLYSSATDDDDDTVSVDSSDDSQNLKFEPPTNRRLGAWRSQGAGDWCAWYTSQRHLVTKLRGPSGHHRVVAVFNLLTPGTQEDDTQQHSNADVLATIPPECNAGSSLYRVPGEVLQIIGSFSTSHDRLAIGRSCCRLRHFLGPVFNLSATLEVCLKAPHKGIKSLGHPLKDVMLGFLDKDQRTECKKRGSHKKRFGFALQHQYSTDGQPFVPLENLRGRDAIFVDAMTKALRETFPTAVSASKQDLEPIVIPVSIVLEAPEDRPGWFVHILDEVQPTSTLRANDKHQNDGVYLIQYELDTEDPLVPRSRIASDDDIVWVSSAAYLTTFVNSHVAEASFKHLWGNMATFDIYWYKSCVVLWKVC